MMTFTYDVTAVPDVRYVWRSEVLQKLVIQYVLVCKYITYSREIKVARTFPITVPFFAKKENTVQIRVEFENERTVEQNWASFKQLINKFTMITKLIYFAFPI